MYNHLLFQTIRKIVVHPAIHYWMTTAIINDPWILNILNPSLVSNHEIIINADNSLISKAIFP